MLDFLPPEFSKLFEIVPEKLLRIKREK